MDRQLKIGFIGAGNMAFGITKGMVTGEGRERRYRAEGFYCVT